MSCEPHKINAPSVFFKQKQIQCLRISALTEPCPQSALLALFSRKKRNENTMKKVLTLLLIGGAIITVQAQSKEETRRVILGDGNGNTAKNGGYGNGRDVILGGGNNNGSYPTYPGNNYPSGNNNRQYQIDQVNRDYDAKIQSIRNNPYLSYDEKNRAIRQLERDRQQRIAQINNAYNGRNDRYNDRPNQPHDNGKHKGWYKDKNKKHGNDRDWDDH
jgi:hypothetical protein